MSWRPTTLAPLLLPVLLAALVLAAPTAPARAAEAGFSCAKARSLVDRLTCDDPALARADGSLAAAYKALLDAVGPDETARARVRAQQRVWLARRDRECAVEEAAGPTPGDKAAIAGCLTDATDQRIAVLGGLRANPSLAGRLRTAVIENRKPGHYLIHADYPQIDDHSVAGAAAFNEAMRRIAEAEIQEFPEVAAAIEASFTPYLWVVSDVYLPAPGLLSVQFNTDGMLGQPQSNRRTVTFDLARGRALTIQDVFAGEDWKAAVTAFRNDALGLETDPAIVAEVDDIADWRFEPRQAVFNERLPGGSRIEVPIAYKDLARHLKPDTLIGRDAR